MRSLRALPIGLLGLAVLATVPSLAADSAWDGVWRAQNPEPRLLSADGRALPFTPSGQTRYDSNRAALRNGSLVDQAVHVCLSQGLPRAMNSPYPLQIVVTPGQVTFLYEENRAYRIVRVTNQHADPKQWDPAFMGEGIARWMGDGLVIDSTNFKADAMYLDATGVPVSEALHVTEHLRLLDGGKRLEDLLTVDDPEIFTKPWTARRVYVRRDDIELKTDWVCGEPHDQPLVRAAHGAASPTPPTPAHMALNGFWANDVRPSSALSIAKAAAGVLQPDAGQSDMRAKQQPWAAAEYQKAAAAMAAGQYIATPEMQCYPSQPPGTGRLAPNNYGLDYLITARYVVVLAEQNAVMRVVHMDRGHPPDLSPGWQGDSVGHWEGDTLVIDTVGFNDRNYLDRGVPFTSKMHVIERLQVVGGKMTDQATLDDPGAFTGPFGITKRYRRGQPFQEYICQENNHEGGVPTSTGQPTPLNLPTAP
jgi:hypothetical protein